MSTLFEALKKLELKRKETGENVRKNIPSRDSAEDRSSFQKQFVIVLVVFTCALIGFVFFSYLQYRKFTAHLFARDAELAVRLEALTHRLAELDQKVQSLDTNSRMAITRLDGFHEELKKEQALRRQAEAKQTKLLDEHKASLKTGLGTQVNTLSERVSRLEDLEREKYLPSGRSRS